MPLDGGATFHDLREHTLSLTPIETAPENIPTDDTPSPSDTLDSLRDHFRGVAYGERSTTPHNRAIHEWLEAHAPDLIVEVESRLANTKTDTLDDRSVITETSASVTNLQRELLVSDLVNARRKKTPDTANTDVATEVGDSVFDRPEYAGLDKNHKRFQLRKLVADELLKLGLLEFLLEKQGYINVYSKEELQLPHDRIDGKLVYEELGIGFDEYVASSDLLNSLKHQIHTLRGRQAEESLIMMTRQSLGIDEPVESANLDELKALRVKWSRRVETELRVTQSDYTSKEDFLAMIDAEISKLEDDIEHMTGEPDIQQFHEGRLHDQLTRDGRQGLVASITHLHRLVSEKPDDWERVASYLHGHILHHLFHLAHPTISTQIQRNNRPYGEDDIQTSLAYHSLLSSFKQVCAAETGTGRAALGNVVSISSRTDRSDDNIRHAS